MKKSYLLLLSLLTMVLAGCSSLKPEPYDYTEFRQSNPKSILVVMPTNSSVEVKASTSVLAQATMPIAELGYYVFPVALVDEVFKQNGLNDGHEIQNASIKKLHQIFGADAVMYIDVEKYGTEFKIIDSVTTVSVRGKLVDLKTGKTLWEGSASANDASNNSQGHPLAQLIVAAVTQIVNTTRDKGYVVAGQANQYLFYAGKNGGLLPGPRLANKPAK